MIEPENLKIHSSRFGKLTFVILFVAFWFVALGIGLQFLSKKTNIVNNVGGTITQSQKIVDEESVVIDVVKKVSPSVVSIAVENKFLFDPFSFGQQGSQKGESGIGTGFVISREGLIITNKHVVSDDTQKYTAIIKANDGTEKKLPVTKVSRDPFNDLALIQVDGGDLIPVDLGDSDHLQVGQKVIAIGNALGRFNNTVTTGVVSGLGRGVSPVDPSTGVAERLDDLIQTDAAINPGNSGGPLLNSAGQVIGINSAVADAQNIGFALKINIAKQLISDFKSSGGKISRPFLGVRYTHISKDVALLNEVPEGEYVREIVSGSSADKGGLKVGDIIVSFNDQKLTDENSLTKIVQGKKVGDVLKARVFRDGKTLDITLTLGESPN